MGQAAVLGFAQVVEDHVGAERTVGESRVEEGVDHGEAVAHAVGQRCGNQGSLGLAGDAIAFSPQPVFDDLRVHMGILDHHRVIEHRHVGHAAALVAVVEIAAKQRVLLAGWLRRIFGGHDIGIGRQDAAHGTRGNEFAGKDAHRDAGAASLAGRAIGDVLRATEAALGQEIVQLRCPLAHHMGKHLPLHLLRQIGTGRRCREVELGRRGRLRVHQWSGLLVRPLRCAKHRSNPKKVNRPLRAAGENPSGATVGA